MQQQTKPPRKSGRPPKNKPFAPSLGKVDEAPSSETFMPSSPPPGHQRDLFTLKVDDGVYRIMDSLCSSPITHIDLPILESPTNPDAEDPYSPKFLTHLYLVAYNASQWNLCDLVADTWIREFHRLRRKAEKCGKEELGLWRSNEALLRRRRQGKKGFNDKAPEWGEKLRVEDPALDDDVTDFHPALLDQLYSNTLPNCGARLLWADSMALCGSKIEREMARKKRLGETWHPDLIHDILCTTLRMVRRKLTLKIEEGTEGAWCKRYHEHTKYGMPCYREVASKADAESSDEDEAPQWEQAEMCRGEKRGFGDVEDDRVGMSEAKRVRLGYAEREVVDLDAEGDSDSN